MGKSCLIRIEEKGDDCGSQWKNKLIYLRPFIGLRVSIDCRKLNSYIVQDKFPLPFMDQLSDRQVGPRLYSFLMDTLGKIKSPLHLNTIKNNKFACFYGAFSFKLMSFGLCNAPAMFKRFTMSTFLIWLRKLLKC